MLKERSLTVLLIKIPTPTADRKEVSQAWKLIGYADWDFAFPPIPLIRGNQRGLGGSAEVDKFRPQLTTNLDIRAMGR